MKKIIFVLVLIAFAFNGNAQVGIGADMPNTSSQLDVSVQAGDKEVLLGVIIEAGAIVLPMQFS